MKRIFIALMLLLLALATDAIAGPRGMGPAHMGSRFLDSKLGLSPEQSEKLKELRRAYLDEITPLQSRLFTLRAELRILWAAEVPDKDQIALKQKEMLDIKHKIEDITTRHRLECREILTPEQREKAAAMDGDHPMGMGWRPGRMHRGWSGGD